MLLTITQLAAHLGVRERVIQGLVDAGKIPYRKIGKALRFHPAEIEAWWKKLPGQTVPASFTDTCANANGVEAPPDATPSTGMRLVKGRRRHHTVEMPREQA